MVNNDAMLGPDPEDAELAGDLRSIVSDYPHCDPALTLSICADRLDDDPTGDERAGLIVILNATCWYAASGRIGTAKVLEGMTAALVAARTGLAANGGPGSGSGPGPGPGCGHAPGEHPQVGDDREYDVTTGAQLLSPGGRAAYERKRDGEYGDPPLDGWLCPAFLAELADEAVDRLREGLQELFGERETGHLDKRYLRSDGRVDIPRLTRTIRRRFRSDEDSAEAGLWAARRWMAGEGASEDRLGLFLAVCSCVFEWHEGMPRTFFREIEAAVKTVDLAPLGMPCAHEHQAGAHPWAVANRLDRGAGAFAAVNAIYAPEDFEAPGGPFALEEWNCPKQAAELAEAAIADFADWRNMRGDDEDDEKWE
ncbi:hypothetical protein [Streptomyces sp. H27-D2]|uniref:hypothetical protein n=1 Tax=Streptomyces sp. H27-D2 TaxID=3046304 RepID=UPI002DBA053A|nr:hypothetical protein [Streptomyces sp. H27-D2]MEC4020316.1 hypothetical protein [Streptomyces sp. H27-D2]